MLIVTHGMTEKQISPLGKTQDNAKGHLGPGTITHVHNLPFHSVRSHSLPIDASRTAFAHPADAFRAVSWHTLLMLCPQP